MEKTEEQIAREREAVKAMVGAKSNMETVLDRIRTLENALRSASSSISLLKGYIGPSAYMPPIGSNSPVKAASYADDAVASIAKVLA